MQNIPYVRTAADLERKYNLSALPTIEKNTKTNQEQILKTNTMLEEFTAETIKNLENLQDQVDGNVTTYYYSGVPTLLNPPVSDWKEEEYNVHLGDLYYDKDTGYAYRFYLDTEPNIYGWVRITDSDITEALAIANTAQDTADAKRRVFVVEPKPPYDVGDIWFKEDKDLFRCKLGRQKGDSFNNSDWILATNYTDDTTANEAKAELSDYKVYVETTYETQADFIKEKEALELKVSKVETVANDKNKVFTSEPKTPYLPGDVYIKETTVEGMKQNLIYVCQTGRESGDYNPNDFSLQPSYASQSDLKLTDNKIAGVVQSVETLEKEVTTIKETKGNNSLYIEDALESRVLEYGIDGKSEQETRSGKNLYNSATITSVSNGTNNNGVITSNTFSTNNLNLAPYNIVDLEAGTYYFSADIRIISGTPTFNKLNDYIADAEVVSKPTLSTTKQRYVYKKTYTSATQLTRMLFQFSASANAVVEVSNIMISKENTSYEQYGASPSPDFPSEIKNVEGIRNLFDSLKGTSTTKNGMTITCTENSIILNGTTTAIANFWFDNLNIPLKKGAISFLTNVNLSGKGAYVWKENSTNILQTNNSANITIESDKTITQFLIQINSGVTFNNQEFKILLAEGNVSTYVPYGSWLKVETTGKNLFEYNNYLSVRNYHNDLLVENGKIQTTATGNYSYRVLKYTIPKYLIGKEVKLSFKGYVSYKGSSSRNRVSITNENNADTIYYGYADIIALEEKKYKITFTPESNEIYISLYSNLNDTNPTIMYIKDIMLGEEDFDYEQYKENISLIDMNKPNLFINKVFKDNYLVLSTGEESYNSAGCIWEYIKVEPNTTYTLTYNSNDYTFGQRICEYTSDKTFIKRTNAFNSGYSFKTSSTTEYINLSGLKTDSNIKVYEGFNNYYELCSIGDIKDQLIIEEDGSTRIEKLLGKRIFNGSETIKEFFSGTDRTRFSIEVNDIYNYTNRYAIPNVICNYLKPVSQDSTWAIGNISVKTSEKTIWFTLNGNMTQAQVKTWLGNNNLLVYYQLEEPYTIDLGTIDISLFENINHINLLDDIETDTRLKYLINTNLNSTYATKSELVIETNKIESSLNQKVSSEELDTTLEKLSNSITQEINNKENSILLKVSNDYSTKTETNQAKNEAISSANSSTDSKLTNYATNSSVNASLALKVGKNENNQIVSMLNASANEINIKGNRFVLDSTNFKIDKYGNITAKNGKFTGGELFLDDSGGEDAAITIRDNIGYNTLPVMRQDVSGKIISLKSNVSSMNVTKLPKTNDILLETENGWGIKVNSVSTNGNKTTIVLNYYNGSTNTKFASIIATLDTNYYNTYHLTITSHPGTGVTIPTSAGVITTLNNTPITNLLIIYNSGQLNKLSKYSSSGFESDIYSLYSPKGILYTRQDVDDLINLMVEIRESGRELTTEELEKYDMNGDGHLDVYDLLVMQKVIFEGASIQQPGHLSINTATSEEFGATGRIINLKDGWGKDRVNIGLNGIESQGGNLYYRDGDTYELTSYVGGGYVTGSGKGFNLGTLFTPKSLANINSVTLNAGGKLTVRQGGNYLVGSANGGATMSLTYCYAQKMGDNAIGIFYNAPSVPSGVTNNDAIGVIMSDLSITLNGDAEETTMASIVD